MIIIDDVVKEIKVLDPLPRTAVKLAALGRRFASSTIEQVTEVIRYDPALYRGYFKACPIRPFQAPSGGSWSSKTRWSAWEAREFWNN
jgi:hypothetical protein